MTNLKEDLASLTQPVTCVLCTDTCDDRNSFDLRDSENRVDFNLTIKFVGTLEINETKRETRSSEPREPVGAMFLIFQYTPSFIRD